MSELVQRVRTAVVLLASLLVILFVAPEAVAVATATLVVALAAWEWATLARLPGVVGRGVFVALVLGGSAAAYTSAMGATTFTPILLVGLLWWCLAFVLVIRAAVPIPRWLAVGVGFFILVPAWTAFAGLIGAPRDGSYLLVLGLAIVFSADIGAYFAGHRFGRLKLAPRVSPGKTWEGLGGGLLCAMLTALIGGSLLGLPARAMMPLGLAVASLSVVGDLTESLLKRSAGVKDSGHILPGHGGILDRIDGVVAGLPLFALALVWLGRLPG
jgi:phosphatidate cytidylyltransferase